MPQSCLFFSLTLVNRKRRMVEGAESMLFQFLFFYFFLTKNVDINFDL